MNDKRKLFLQTEIMRILELETWEGPSGLNDLEKLYADLSALPEDDE